MDKTDTEWFADETFWERFCPLMFPEARIAAAAVDVPKLVTLTGVSGGSVLDLACGPGRHAVPLAQAGFAVTGVDRTRFLLDKARERADGQGVRVEWCEQDMREFVRPAAFDLAINLFTSFGYFDDQAENRRVLENVFASLKPGGTFVLDHLGKELLAARFQSTGSESLADGTVLIQRREIVDDWSRIDAEWILLELNRVTKYHVAHWLYSGREMHELLASTGFVDVQVYGSLDGTPYGPQAQRLVVVGRKAAAA